MGATYYIGTTDTEKTIKIMAVDEKDALRAAWGNRKILGITADKKKDLIIKKVEYDC